MDMQVRGSVDEGMHTQASELTRCWLRQQVQVLADQCGYRNPSQLEKWPPLTLLAAAVGLLAVAASPSIIPPMQNAVVTSIFLLFEAGLLSRIVDGS
ncbi:hypothetical protein QE424_001797 [Stenotrophomonas rhizophila]|uniref:Uncharacterized protein n=1 Tax=Stenotrophomonas rhizophila TaxID=216778 RepID=A0AAP5AIP9_9GAMM|nr:hypothetical protein [Stenotrophomonas rhizophila]MDQ1108638.1 hypothetical protein [Stenotrophomonas rhizophila]